MILVDNLKNEYMFHNSEYRIYLDDEEISDNAEKFEECVNNGYCVDIITLESTVSIVVKCNDDVITLLVPGYTTIKEIHDVIDWYVSIRNSLS